MRCLHLAGMLGIITDYVAGKPAGILGSVWLLTHLSRGRLRPPAAVRAAGARSEPTTAKHG